MNNTNIVEYKGYFTLVQYSFEDQVLYGKIEGITDLVTFECKTADEVEAAFQEAVDDYLLFCEDIGQEPNKTYKGTFNVRIPPALHRAADMERIKQGISLNQLITKAIESFLKPKQNMYIKIALPDSVLSGYQTWNEGKTEKLSGKVWPTEVRYAAS